MAHILHLSLPGISCINCVIPIEKVLDGCRELKIISYSTDLVEKEISITVDDPRPRQEVTAILRNTLDEIGVETHPVNPRHLTKGLVGMLAGAAVIALTLSGIALPLFATWLIAGASIALTLFLGKESYRDAAKKLVKARTFTMDALFAVSTLTVIAVSIASLFVPWLPMMLDAGLLIFGFRHIGKAIEQSIRNKITSGLSFKSRAPAQVIKKISASEWQLCESLDLVADDIIRVKPGEVLPVDGLLESSRSLFYKTILTGSPNPSAVERGQAVSAGMRVPENAEPVDIRVTKPVSESHLAFLDHTITQSNTEKASIEHRANTILQYFVPGMLALAALTGIVIGVLFSPAHAIQCATALLVSACPCILGFITPLAMKIGMTKSLENGVLFKNTKSLQDADQVDTVVFDLNGTLTTGVPEVTDYQIYPGSLKEPAEFFSYLNAMEKESTHSFGKEIYRYSQTKLTAPKNLKIRVIPQTNGIRAWVNDKVCLLGNADFLRQHGIAVPDQDLEDHPGKHCIYLVIDQQCVGQITLKDPLREEARQVVETLKKMGKDVRICTGDFEKTAKSYARELQIPEENVHAGCLDASDNPNTRTKTAYIQQLKQQKRRVAMIGDSGNDAAAIASSDFGIAVKSESADRVTQDQAGAIINNNSLLSVVTAFTVANQTMSSIWQNLKFSLAYNTVMAFLAGGAMLTMGVCFNPALGVALMIVQSVLVLGNQYRIRRQALSHLSAESKGAHRVLESTYGVLRQDGILGNRVALVKGQSDRTDKASLSQALLKQQLIPADRTSGTRYSASSSSARCTAGRVRI